MLQNPCVIDLLKECGKLACKLAITFVEPDYKLGLPKEDLDVDKEMYRKVVRTLIYLSHNKPVIAYAYHIREQTSLKKCTYT